MSDPAEFDATIRDGDGQSLVAVSVTAIVDTDAAHAAVAQLHDDVETVQYRAEHDRLHDPHPDR